MEGLGIWGYFSSSSGLQSNSSSSSELWERLRQGGGGSKLGSSSVPCGWQTEVVPFTFLVLAEWVEMQLTVLWGCLCRCVCELPGRASGWDITGSAAGSRWLFLLHLDWFGCSAVSGSVLTSDGLPKQWPREEQGSPCMLGDSEETKRDSKISQNCTDIRWIWGFPVCRATLGS